jgi:hypothetical protein
LLCRRFVEFKIASLVEDESENECVQQSKEIEKCAYDSSEENEEGFESGERTFAIVFCFFQIAEAKFYNVSDQKSSRHDVEYEESNGLANENYLPLCFSSFELLKANHEQIEKVDKRIVVKSHFPSPEIDEDIQQDFQQNKVLQSCFSSPMNDVVVQIPRSLDMDEGSETASMEISSSEKTNDIEFQESNKTVYATVQSEIQKDNKEEVVLFDSFEDHGFENASMGTPEGEMVHVVLFTFARRL